jgi:kynurenine 3-monooxygenase
MKLEQEHPEYYSKYSLVTFKPEMSYAEAMMKGRAQDEKLLDIVSKVHDIGGLDVEKVLDEVLTD